MEVDEPLRVYGRGMNKLLILICPRTVPSQEEQQMSQPKGASLYLQDLLRLQASRNYDLRPLLKVIVSIQIQIKSVLRLLAGILR